MKLKMERWRWGALYDVYDVISYNTEAKKRRKNGVQHLAWNWRKSVLATLATWTSNMMTKI